MRQPGVARLIAEGPDGARGREQPARRLRRGPARALGRPARPLEPLRRDRHAGGLLPLRARRGGARRGGAHRPRPLGHAAARQSPRAVGGDPARDAALSRARSLRHAARLRVDQLDPRPPPRALLRGRGRRLQLGRSALRVAPAALGGARGPAGAHLRPPLGGRPDPDQLGDPARPALRAGDRDRLGPRQQRGDGLALPSSTTRCPGTSSATPSTAATGSASSAAATATTVTRASRSSPRPPAVWRPS